MQKSQHPIPPMSPKRPPHPGEILRRDYLEPRGIAVVDAAEGLGISRKHLHAILAGRAPVTPEMALRLGTALGAKPELWVELQAAYDRWQVLEELRRAPRPKVKTLRGRAG